MSRARQLCWWIGMALYLLFGYALYNILQFFPRFHNEHSDAIYSIAWLPLGVLAFWVQGKLEDWVTAKD